MSKQILSFDIGIKNLAWCCTSLSGELIYIQGWGNYNLLEGRETESKEGCLHCKTCGGNAKYISNEGLVCGRHVPATRPIWKDLSGVAYTKLPPVKLIRGFLTQKGLTPVPTKRDLVVEKLQEYVSIPAKKAKTPHAAALDTSATHDSLRKFVQTQLRNHFYYLDEVRIENQPVLKNPVMKTIQMLLFATLRDAIFETNQPKVPIFKLVHAGMKVKGAAKGDAGYKARKDGADIRVRDALTKKNVARRAEWLTFFEGHKKRSDLADAFCMCLDAYPLNAVKDA
jgi:hypothetical protein